MFLLSFGGARLLVRFEDTHTAVSPGGGKLCWLTCVSAAAFLPSAPELVCQLHHGAEQGGAVIAGEFDEGDFLDEAAEFDELAGACATFLNPIAGVVLGLVAFEAVSPDADAAKLRRCCLQIPK